LKKIDKMSQREFVKFCSLSHSLNSKFISSYLDRTLKQKVNTIQELEDKLTELSKVRHEENENTKKCMQDWENKYKAMHDNLTSEIKLLTGKLNSMEVSNFIEIQKLIFLLMFQN
jgi:hypothetical protein